MERFFHPIHVVVLERFNGLYRALNVLPAHTDVYHKFFIVAESFSRPFYKLYVLFKTFAECAPAEFYALIMPGRHVLFYKLVDFLFRTRHKH